MEPGNKKKNVLRIGIAGFMGAGKTTLARFAAQINPQAMFIDADAEAKRLMQQNWTIKKNLADSFGTSVLFDENINFDRLGALVFSSRDRLLSLNAIVHPPLVARLKELVFSHGEQPVICDAALIPLWRVEPWFDRVVWVRAPFDTRLERLSKKGLFSRKELMVRMHLQQTLFPEPGEAPWKIVENNETLDQFKKKAMGYFAFGKNYSK